MLFRSGPAADALVAVAADHLDGDKCVRCWRYVHDISADDAYAGLCGRCVEAVA